METIVAVEGTGLLAVENDRRTKMGLPAWTLEEYKVKPAQWIVDAESGAPGIPTDVPDDRKAVTFLKRFVKYAYPIIIDRDTKQDGKLGKENLDALLLCFSWAVFNPLTRDLTGHSMRCQEFANPICTHAMRRSTPCMELLCRMYREEDSLITTRIVCFFYFHQWNESFYVKGKWGETVSGAKNTGINLWDQFPSSEEEDEVVEPATVRQRIPNPSDVIDIDDHEGNFT